MIILEEINNSFFVGNNCLITNYNKIVNVTCQKPGIYSGAMVKNIQPNAGTYEITINILSHYQTFWFGDYINASKILLKNGINKFNIKIGDVQNKQFMIGIFSSTLEMEKSFKIINVKIIKLDKSIPNKKQTFNISNGKKSYQSIIASKYFLKMDKKTVPILITDNVKNDKKNVLLIIDEPNWCYDNKSKIFENHYKKDYNIYIASSRTNPNYLTKFPNINFNNIVKFWYGYDYQDPFLIYPNAKKAICITDYIHWNRKITKQPNNSIFQNFLKNIKNADCILYNCPMIRDLLYEQYPDEVDNKPLYPIFDGVDINKFTYQDYKPHANLVVGWVGDSSNIHKRFSILKKLVENENWINLVVQDKKNFIPHNKMVNFYHSIDVLVCLSEAEGTPNPILEASASGRTWISTDVGIVSLLYNSGKDNIKPGIIINEPDELLPNLKLLHENKKMMYAMGKIARENVAKDFSWDIRIKAYNKIFNVIISNEEDSDNDVSIAVPNDSFENLNKKNLNNLKTEITFPKKIIITSTQYPRYGGAATCAYEMHKYFIKQNIPSVCLFFDNNNEDVFNPNDLLNVYHAPLSDNYNDLNNINYDNIKNILANIYGEEPYLVYALNYYAPIISKHIFSKSTIYYMTTGCNYINKDNLVDATSFLNRPFDVYDKLSIEKITIRLANAIIPNSQLIKNIYEHCYKTYFNDMIDLHEIFEINGANPDNMIRDYDIAFICSNFNRNVKNVDLIKSIYTCDGLENAKKICIGKFSKSFFPENTKNIIYKDFLQQEEIVKVLNQCKIVLVPSYIESYSITAVEATKCGCIVLTTKNVGCAITINKFFVLDTYCIDEWIDKINIILNNYSYFKEIFFNDYHSTPPITDLWNVTPSVIGKKINIICSSVDAPYMGGSATNLYRIIKELADIKEFNIYGIFISNFKTNHNPDRLNNIIHIPLNEEMENKLIDLKKIINNKIGHIDFILCKSYKIIPLFKKIFRGSKIIFTPSGIINNNIIFGKKYLLDMNIGKNDSSEKNDNDMDTNYQHLNDYSIKQSDMLVPNSLLTYNVINKIYSNPPNLYFPISLSNIINEKINDNNFMDRSYDIIFCAYNWKRKCKNYDLALKIINHPSLEKYKIIIVGENHNGKYGNNVISKNYMKNLQLLELLTNVKVLVVPSRFDSNPNILTEAIVSGCNVVTSRNVGNYENLDKKCIVDNYQNVEDWIEAIKKCSEQRFPYYGPTKEKIILDIKNLFIKYHKKSVGIYKIPPTINNIFNKTTLDVYDNFSYREATDNTFVNDIISYDMYFLLFIELSIKENCKSINYILYDDTIDENIYVNVSKLYPYYPSGTFIWKIRDAKSFSYFNNAEFYFVRGTYYNFFKFLIPGNAKSIFYPATSLGYKKPKKNKLLTNQKFSIILKHEDSLYDNKYLADKIVIFHKFVSDKFVCYNTNERIYDICFIATAKQTTKNHDLFLHFICYLENIRKKCRIIYVGDLEYILQENCMTNKIRNFQTVKLDNRINCCTKEIIDIYNQSKINILFSGRDAYPRVISESSACGCFNIALDTLTDGKNFYDGYLGKLVGNNNIKKILKDASSLSYTPNIVLWQEIITYMDKTYNHYDISVKFKKKYNLQNTITSIC